MSLQCGIVGLPNVGKSTLFNALTQSAAAQAANYPFCTIEPNTGIVSVPDARLNKLAAIAGSAKIIPAAIEFVDIAGLVKGASKGEGLGNKFLSRIRGVEAIAHVLRCFEDHDITHVHGKVDPIYDAEIIEMELMLSDMESVERRLANAEKRLKSGDKSIKEELELLAAAKSVLAQGKPVRSLTGAYSSKALNSLQLITSKPVLYVCNVLESEVLEGNRYTEEIAKKAAKENAGCVIISSKIESEIALLASEEEKQNFLEMLGLEEPGLSRVIREAYGLLNLQSFFTIGPKEAHAWTFGKGATAPQAAGIIHTDFEKGFIRAEVIGYDDYINYNGEVKVKEAGKMRLEGKEYIMQDGDVVHFRFNV